MLKVSELKVSYGQSEVIHGIDFESEQNEILAIMGRNGMGKSTLFKSLMGLMPASGGQISLDGTVLNSLESYQRVWNGLAYVPQGRMVFSNMTVTENILSGLPNGKTKVPDEIYALFPVLLEMRHRKAGNLSGGQQQQLAIARALVTDPKVLLLDEPTEGIQPSIIKDIARLLVEIKHMRNITIIVSEQILSFALDVADRLLVMDRGLIVEQMSRQEADAEKLSGYLSV